MTALIDELGGFATGAVVAVMVSSLNGVVAIDGRVGALTGDADQELLLGLRERAGAVVVGAATVRAEGYDRLLPDTARVRRRQLGLPPEPELVVVGRGDERARDAGDGPDLHRVLSSVRARAGGRGTVVVEGGPTVFAAAFAQRVLTDFVLAVSPVVADGRHWRPAAGTQNALVLEAHTARGGFAFLRYGVRT